MDGWIGNAPANTYSCTVRAGELNMTKRTRLCTLLCLASLSCRAAVPPTTTPSAEPPKVSTSITATSLPPQPNTALPKVAATVLASNLGEVTAMAVDTTSVYIAKINGEIVRVALAGGAAVVLTKLPARTEVTALAAASEGLYVAMTNSGIASGKWGQGSLVLVPANGGEQRVVAAGQAIVLSLLLDDNRLYWAAASVGKRIDWALWTLDRKTGQLQSHALPKDLALLRLYGQYKGELLVGDMLGGVFAYSFSGTKRARPVGTLLRVECANVVGDQLMIAGTNTNADLVGSSNLTGGSSDITVLAELGTKRHIGGMAVRAGFAYFSDMGTSEHKYKDGAIRKVGIDGTAESIVATDQFQPGTILATSSGIVWLNERGSTAVHDGDAEVLFLPDP
jgi:hypothetical protein